MCIAPKIYTEARKRGVLFIPFDKSEKLEIYVKGNQITLNCFDPVMGEKISLNLDFLSLATGIVPSKNDNLNKILKIRSTKDGFIKEANYKWRPVDTGLEGLFVCGLARAPQRVGEALDEGRATAMRALRILSHKEISASGNSAIVRHTNCTQCELCVDECPYEARYSDSETGRILVDPVSCQDCGSCSAICPNSASITGMYEDAVIMEIIENIL